MIAAENSTETAPTQVGKPWQKGQSGNPGGRPKIAAEVKAEAQKYTAEAVETLVRWMRSDDPQASIRAATALLDRGCGRPEQAVALTGTEQNRPLVFVFDPFKDHREQLNAQRPDREEQAAIPADTQALPCSDAREGQE